MFVDNVVFSPLLWIGITQSVFVFMTILSSIWGWDSTWQTKFEYIRSFVWMIPYSLLIYHQGRVYEYTRSGQTIVKTFGCISVSSVLFSFIARLFGAQNVSITNIEHKSWSNEFTGVMVGCAMVALGLLVFHIHLCPADERVHYCVCLLGFVAVGVIPVFIWNVTVHIHHYIIGLFLACFSRFPRSHIGYATQCFLTGMFIQGMQAYGPDRVYMQT